MSRFLRALIVLSALGALSAAGCGGSDFKGEANGLCKKYNAKIKAVPSPKGQSELAGYLDKVAPLVAAGTAKLKALRPPSSNKSAYQSFLTGLDKEVAVAQEADQAAKAGNTKQAVSLLQQQSGLSKDVDAKASAAGLKECAKG